MVSTGGYVATTPQLHNGYRVATEQLHAAYREATWQQAPAALIARLSDLSVLQLPAVVLPHREMQPPGEHQGLGLRV